MEGEHAKPYEDQPRRRRDDDLTVNEWRLLRLEKICDNVVSAKDFERVRTDVRDLYGKIEGVNGKIDSLKTWITGTAVGICTVIVTAAALVATLGHR